MTEILPDRHRGPLKNPQPEKRTAPLNLFDAPAPQQPEWIVEGLLPAGLSVFVGPPSSLKSMYALYLGCVVAKGKPLNGAPVSPLRVILCDLENSIRSLKIRAFQILGMDPSSPNLKILSPALRDPRFMALPYQPPGGRPYIVSDPALWTLNSPHFKHYLDGADNLLIVDPLSGAHSQNDNANNEMAYVMRQLNELRHAHRTTGIILVAHTGHGPEKKERVRGAIEIEAAADWIAVVSRERQTIHVKPKKARALGSGVRTFSARFGPRGFTELEAESPQIAFDYEKE